MDRKYAVAAVDTTTPLSKRARTQAMISVAVSIDVDAVEQQKQCRGTERNMAWLARP